MNEQLLPSQDEIADERQALLQQLQREEIQGLGK